jgi:hypothetical protein
MQACDGIRDVFRHFQFVSSTCTGVSAVLYVIIIHQNLFLIKCNIVPGLNPFSADPAEDQIRWVPVGALYGVRRKHDGKQVSCARKQESNQDCGV